MAWRPVRAFTLETCHNPSLPSPHLRPSYLSPSHPRLILTEQVANTTLQSLNSFQMYRCELLWGSCERRGRRDNDAECLFRSEFCTQATRNLECSHHVRKKTAAEVCYRNRKWVIVGEEVLRKLLAALTSFMATFQQLSFEPLPSCFLRL